MTWVLDNTGAEVFKQVGGSNSSLFTAAYTPVAIDETSTGTAIGGRNDGAGASSLSHIRQHLIYNSVHSAGDQALVRAGLTAKWSGLGL